MTAVVGGGIAKALSELDAARETRKRKRGALQDISNKKALPGTATGLSSGKAALGAVKKPAVAGVSSISVVTATNRLRAVNPPTASAASRLPRPSLTASKKFDAVTKRRKPENDEPHVSHKVQTSMLSFQKSSIAAPASLRPGHPTVLAPAESRLPGISKPSATTAALLKKLPAASSEADASRRIEHNEDMESDGMHDSDDGTARAQQPIVIPQPSASTSSYVPRPYTFTFDHTESGFDEPTYCALIRDIDALVTPNATAPCAKLARELDTYYRKHEEKYLPESTYIGSYQTDINEKMRTILVDWLVEVGEEYDLDSQTFHKAVNLVDRCLTKFKINRKQFQLLGCACMMIAAKFEEVYGPNVEEFVYISDQTYTAEEMLEMESKVLQALEYRIASTTCYGFIRRYTAAGCLNEKQSALVMYLSDFALLHYRLLKYRPSQIAASAVYLARVMTGEKEPWTPTLHHYSKYNPWDLQSCVLELCRLHKVENAVVGTQREKAKAVSEKYLAEKFHSASSLPSADEAELEKSFFKYDPRPAPPRRPSSKSGSD
ncbi:hypothetical protein PybrP1_010710 [[Pythium] brassicae (nom. inval.)]|nr:hypothetical protein PybrP1_010710 [[Pythium] brassicae (nom. inval.)]